jgi:hypothetical protein
MHTSKIPKLAWGFVAPAEHLHLVVYIRYRVKKVVPPYPPVPSQGLIFRKPTPMILRVSIIATWGHQITQ